MCDPPQGPRSFWFSCWPYLGPRGEWFRPTFLQAHVPADPHQGAPQHVRPSHELAVSFQRQKTVTLTRCMTQSRSSSISLRSERRPTQDAVCQYSEVRTVHAFTAADRSAPPHPPRKTLSAREHLYFTFSVLLKCLAALHPCSPSDANLPGQLLCPTLPRPIFNPHDNCSRQNLHHHQQLLPSNPNCRSQETAARVFESHSRKDWRGERTGRIHATLKFSESTSATARLPQEQSICQSSLPGARSMCASAHGITWHLIYVSFFRYLTHRAFFVMAPSHGDIFTLVLHASTPSHGYFRLPTVNNILSLQALRLR